MTPQTRSNVRVTLIQGLLEGVSDAQVHIVAIDVVVHQASRNLALLLLLSIAGYVLLIILRRRQLLELNARELHLLKLVGLRALARCKLLCLRRGRSFLFLIVSVAIDPLPEEP